MFARLELGAFKDQMQVCKDTLCYISTMLLVGLLCGCSLQRVDQEKQPTPPGNSYLQRGYEYLKQRQWNEAIREFEGAVAVDPDSAIAHAALGWAYYRAGRPDLALREGEEVLRLEPENEQVRTLVELLRERQ